MVKRTLVRPTTGKTNNHHGFESLKVVKTSTFRKALKYNIQRRELVCAAALGLGLGGLAAAPQGLLASTKAPTHHLGPGWINPERLEAFFDLMRLRHGMEADWLNARFKLLEQQDRALALMNPPPDKPPADRPPPSLSRRLALNLDERTVREGRQLLANQVLFLERAEDLYGVPPEVVVGILGVETRYGRITGSFRVLDTLASLGFQGERRRDFFLKELESLLVMGRRGDIDLFKSEGSFAGALGIPQFMPSSWQAWGVDFDQDGRVDLINSMADAMGSVANFLKSHGWKRGLPSFAPLKLRSRDNPADFLVTRLSAEHRLGDIERALPIPKGWRSLPQDLPASIIRLPEPNSAPVYWLVSENFFAVTHYNRSYLYAASVLSLANAIR
jgi:membrane-bound lytic murein transglycosylase B